MHASLVTEAEYAKIHDKNKSAPLPGNCNMQHRKQIFKNTRFKHHLKKCLSKIKKKTKEPLPS